MNPLLEIVRMVETSSLWALVFLALSLNYLGSKYCGPRSRADVGAKAIAAAFLLGYWGNAWFRWGAYDASVLMGIVWRGVLAATLVLGGSRIFLPIIEFFSSRCIEPVRAKYLAWRADKQWKRQQLKAQKLEQERKLVKLAEREELSRQKQQQQQREEQQAEQKAAIDQLRRQLRLELQLLYDTERKTLGLRMDAAEFEKIISALDKEDSKKQLQKQYRAIKKTLQQLLTQAPADSGLRSAQTVAQQLEAMNADFETIEQQLKDMDEETRQIIESELQQEKENRLRQIVFGTTS